MSRTRPLHTGHLPQCDSGPLPLEQLVGEISSALADGEPGLLLRVTGNPVQLGFRPLDDQHPLDFLVGFTAPPEWLAIGVHCSGRAHHLDRATPEPRPVVITTLVDRSGRGRGLLRYLPSGSEASTGPADEADEAGDDGAPVARYDDAPEGLVGDACRRALGLPTAPPPASTAELWLRLWLDRVVEAAAFSDDVDSGLTWREFVALHPAVALGSHDACHARGPSGPRDPDAVTEATLALARTWDWTRLRSDPEVLAFAGPPVSPEIAAWMDDGMFARVVLADLAPLPVVARSIRQLLPQPMLDDIDEVVMATGLSWCERSEVVVQ